MPFQNRTFPPKYTRNNVHVSLKCQMMQSRFAVLFSFPTNGKFVLTTTFLKRTKYVHVMDKYTRNNHLIMPTQQYARDKTWYGNAVMV